MKNILLVDDKTDIREALADFLCDHDYKTELCDKGAHAMEKAKNNLYDLVVTDLLMPQQDGFSFFKEFKSLPSEQERNTPVIIMTGGSRSLDFQKGLDDLNAQGCKILKKPFTKDQFIRAVDKALTS